MKTVNKQGFTLVETLIVLAIIAILSILAVGGYGQYRRAALVNLYTDSIVSQIKEYRDKTIYGNFGGERFEEIKTAVEEGTDLDEEENLPGTEAQCFGFYFENSESGYVPVSFSQLFTDKQEWVETGFSAVGCGDFNRENPESYIRTNKFELDKAVEIFEVNFAGVNLDNPGNFVMRFSPPEGNADYSLSSGTNFEKAFEKKELIIGVKYGKSEEDRYKKQIIMDLSTGHIETKNYEESV